MAVHVYVHLGSRFHCSPFCRQWHPNTALMITWWNDAFLSDLLPFMFWLILLSLFCFWSCLLSYSHFNLGLVCNVTHIHREIETEEFKCWHYIDDRTIWPKGNLERLAHHFKFSIQPSLDSLLSIQSLTLEQTRLRLVAGQPWTGLQHLGPLMNRSEIYNVYYTCYNSSPRTPLYHRWRNRK